jgi:Mg2+ and Co2+ transporter CorA
MGSPGAGKTALLEATARRLRCSRRLDALTGDLATERDADRPAQPANGARARTVHGSMTTSQPLAMLIADPPGIRPVATAAELRDVLPALDFFWLDVFAGDDAAKKDLLAQLRLDAADTAWALRFGQVMRMAIGRAGVRVVTSLSEPDGAIDEVHVLCSPGYVLTVWSGDPAALDEPRRHFLDRVAELRKSPFHAAAIVLQLLLATLDQAITVLDTKLHEAQERLYRAPDASEFAALTREMQRLHSRWASFDRYGSAVRSAIVGVEAVPGMDPRGAAELNDYAEQVEDAEQRLHDRTELASGIMQDYAAATAHRQADQINRLTLVSLIFLPITFITGFFGMNFGWLSRSISSAGAFVSLGVILPGLSVVLTIGWLRRRNIIWTSRPRS